MNTQNEMQSELWSENCSKNHFEIIGSVLRDQFNKEQVHEVLSKMAGIIDIKYPYEEHKELFPKNSNHIASDWGKGYGLIRPHSDDLYEDRDINIMSLTVFSNSYNTGCGIKSWPLVSSI
jgi:hypothetical protein